MEGVPRNPPLRSLSQTPLAARLAAWRLHWTPLLALVAVQFVGIHLRWELVLTVFALTVAFELWLLFGHDPHRQFEPVVRALHRDLPWFHAEATTWVEPAQVPALREALELRSVRLLELDGSSIRSAADLVAELERHCRPRRWPRDPVARSVAMLSKLGAGADRGVAVLWQHAETFADGDAEGHARFAARWAATVARDTPRVLLFLGKAAPEPGMGAAVPPAPLPGAWWRRNPGELAT